MNSRPGLPVASVSDSTSDDFSAIIRDRVTNFTFAESTRPTVQPIESSIPSTSPQAAMRTASEFADNGCPSTPGFGGTPPYLAGREQEQHVISRSVSRLASRVPTPSGLVIYGPRGYGKTVLLNWAVRLARQRGIKAISLSAVTSETEEGLTRKLTPDSVWTGIFRAVSWRGANPSVESLQARTVHEGLANWSEENRRSC